MSELALGQIKGLTVNSNVVTVPSGHTLYAPGHVLQVKQTVLDTTMSFSTGGGTGAPTTSNTSSVMTCSITPKYASSKILVFIDVKGYASGSSPILSLFRGSTAIGNAASAGNRRLGITGTMYDSDANQIISTTANFLDSPATTSSVTYDIRIWADNTNLYVINRSGNDSDNSIGSRSTSTITLMEIAA